MFENNRDRGKIKWTAMMLPEHIAMLRDWHAEDGRVPQPILTDFELEEIQLQLESAKLRRCIAQVSIWSDDKISSYIGTIEEIDIRNRLIVLEDPFCIERIPADLIIAVQHLD
ncbi:hypothetical protein NCCP2716_28030 [Sporosarcina sp. NCCP-2716]|uniref:YolD-like family protein n=1 Tax=Sporosarcina sp. NCCP-2716 TaxID=2943679 RepID=UPI00203FCEFD|nr:YolD-like family protein [Sporosarcina sp. NCCP-2716]GKV70305.1 hypothetical protein NCCP2716_28030 [Sporosarcina sp. NCCP-2716]